MRLFRPSTPSSPSAPSAPFSPSAPGSPGSPWSPFSPGSPSLTSAVSPSSQEMVETLPLCETLHEVPSEPFLPLAPSSPPQPETISTTPASAGPMIQPRPTLFPIRMCTILPRARTALLGSSGAVLSNTSPLTQNPKSLAQMAESPGVGACPTSFAERRRDDFQFHADRGAFRRRPYLQRRRATPYERALSVRSAAPRARESGLRWAGANGTGP